jgi:hypothetical protein
VTVTAAACGISRRVRRIAEINWVTVSWVATASSSNVESNAWTCLALQDTGRIDHSTHRVEDPFPSVARQEPRTPNTAALSIRL